MRADPDVDGEGRCAEQPVKEQAQGDSTGAPHGKQTGSAIPACDCPSASCERLFKPGPGKADVDLSIDERPLVGGA